MIKIKLFFKSFYLSAVLVLCLFIGIFGTATAYQNMRQTGFGEYKKAVRLDGNSLWILDFEIEL